MATIKVPRPPEDSYNPDRPVSALLKAQIRHLHEAERGLPLRHHTDIYTKAIKTEGEAAEYIGRVTEAIHKAHKMAAAKRAKARPKITIAAVAEVRKVKRTPAKKKSRKKSSRT